MSRRTFKIGFWDGLKEGAREGYEEGRRTPLPDELADDRVRNELVTEPYQYSPLKDGALSMRVLELLPGTRQDDIALDMRETNLDECQGSYEALSYVWLDMNERTPILINGQTLEIGSNLRCALLNLRLVDKPRILWIDAICIDQTNDQERNQQVAMMGNIYRRALQTVIWLCPEQREKTANAFSAMEDLAQEAISMAQADGSIPLTDVKQHHLSYLNNKPISMMEKDNMNTPMFYKHNNDESIMHVAGSPWWKRTWTTQEILLASRATIVAGRYSMDWDRFCVGVNHGLNIGIWIPLTMGVILDPVVTPYLSLLSLRWKREVQGPKETHVQDLLEILIHCRFRDATNPRDKVYGLLGLVTDPSLSTGASVGITPDYTSSVSAVYIRTAQQILSESGKLDLLGVGTCSSSGPDIPSWAPDWSRSETTALPMMHDALGQSRSTHATRHSVALFQFIDADTTLVLQAQELTTIEALSLPLNRIEYNSEAMINDLEKECSREDSDSMAGRLARLSAAWKVIASTYSIIMSVVPHLAIYADWETFAREVPVTNPVPAARKPSIDTSKPNKSPVVLGSISSLIRSASNLSVATGLVAEATEEDEPYDPLAVYWQTLCMGTYVPSTDAAAIPGKSPKARTKDLFYSWRASLKPIRDLHRWHADRAFRPLGFVGYVRKTWRGYGEFMRFLEGAYERRLGRGANGYLCLVPATAEVGDKVILAKGGRVPLLVRPDNGYWRVVGETYVHGIMDGEVWDESKCVEFRMK